MLIRKSRGNLSHTTFLLIRATAAWPCVFLHFYSFSFISKLLCKATFSFCFIYQWLLFQRSMANTRLTHSTLSCTCLSGFSPTFFGLVQANGPPPRDPSQKNNPCRDCDEACRVTHTQTHKHKPSLPFMLRNKPNV